MTTVPAWPLVLKARAVVMTTACFSIVNKLLLGGFRSQLLWHTIVASRQRCSASAEQSSIQCLLDLQQSAVLPCLSACTLHTLSTESTQSKKNWTSLGHLIAQLMHHATVGASCFTHKCQHRKRRATLSQCASASYRDWDLSSSIATWRIWPCGGSTLL